MKPGQMPVEERQMFLASIENTLGNMYTEMGVMDDAIEHYTIAMEIANARYIYQNRGIVCICG